MPKLVIFRHGETIWNERGLLTGQKDIPLTKQGQEQATDAGWWLRHIKFDRVYSSSLSRAIETAAITLDATSPTNDHLKTADNSWDILIKDELVERDIGEFSGKPSTNDTFKMWPKSYEEAINGGESTADVVKRVEQVYRNEIYPAILNNENALVVVHAGIIIAFKVILGYMTTMQAVQPKERVPNAVPWVIEFNSEGKNIKDYLIQA